MTKQTMTKNAYAKINLGLDVTGRRADGYHTVRMVMQTISLHDTVSVTLTEAPKITMTCDRPGLSVEEDNLCIKAARLMREMYDLPGGIRIDLKKRIPMAAGLAGGSTDAAAVMTLLRDLCLPEVSDKALEEAAVKLGADIPFCIRGGTQKCEGIGEILTADQAHRFVGVPVLIAKPAFPVSTKEVYAAYDGASAAGQGRLTADPDEAVAPVPAAGAVLTVHPKLPAHPDIDRLWDAIGAKDQNGVVQRLGNVLADVTEPMHPRIAELRRLMTAHGADGALMSGSGPTVFGIFSDREEMHACAERLREEPDLECVAETETVCP